MNKLNKIKGILIDLEGVLYLGDKVIEGAIDTIKKINSKNIKIRYLTNTTTVPKKNIFSKLKNFNIPVQENEIFSPVIAAKNYLNNRNISNIYLMTNDVLKNDFSNFIIDEIKAQAIVVGDIFKEFNWEKLNKSFQIVNNNNAIIIALHKNRYCLRDGEISLDLGPFVQALEYATSTEAIIMGKPEKNFFDLAINDMQLNNDQVLMIGDDIISDIQGSKRNNIFSIQVKTGKYQIKDESDQYIQPDLRIKSIKELAIYF